MSVAGNGKKCELSDTSTNRNNPKDQRESSVNSVNDSIIIKRIS